MTIDHQQDTDEGQKRMTHTNCVPHYPKSKLVNLSSGVLSEMTHAGTNNPALKKFMIRSKILRHREKMDNVKQWRNNSIACAAEHRSIVENPPEQSNMGSNEVDFERIGQIEDEFDELEQKMV
jgi:hypothetical protein